MIYRCTKHGVIVEVTERNGRPHRAFQVTWGKAPYSPTCALLQAPEIKAGDLQRFHEGQPVPGYSCPIEEVSQ